MGTLVPPLHGELYLGEERGKCEQVMMCLGAAKPWASDVARSVLPRCWGTPGPPKPLGCDLPP